MANMVNIQEECKKRFPIGSVIKNTDGKEYTVINDDALYEIYNEMVYGSAGQGCLYDGGRWGEVISLPDGTSVIVNIKEIQEECKKRFPIGSVVRTTCGDRITLQLDNYTYKIYSNNTIYAQSGQGCLYEHGKWAGVISLPEMNMKEIQEECKRNYPIGCEFIPTNSTGVNTLVEDSKVYSIHGNEIYASDCKGLLYQNGKWAELISLGNEDSIYFPDLSKHIGRYLKALIASPNGGAVSQGEYGLIRSERYVDFPRHGGYVASKALTEEYLNKFYELMPEGFSPSEYIQGKEKEYVMIEEAKKRYPIGTMFKPAQCKTPNSEFCVVTNTNFKFQNGHVYALTDTGGIWTDAGKYGNTQSNRIVYHGDKKVWADYHNPQIITSIAGFSGLSIQHEKQDTKTFINDVLSVDIKLSKKKKRIRF